MSITVTDLFCGAGGSSSGAITVPGVQVRMAANHWRLAIETHNENHPSTDHDCADISQVDPRRYPRTDILWASPECTNHSQAKGRKRHVDSTPDLFGEVLPDEAAERSRATMWDVIRFAEHHRYQVVIVENVVDAADWVMMPAWRQAFALMGYCLHEVYLNSMHAHVMGDPAPQSRDRYYGVAHQRDDARGCPDLAKFTRPHAFCLECGEWVRAVQGWKNPDRRRGRYRAQYRWRCPNATCRNAVVEPPILPAAAAIDWTLPGERIGDRARPLAAKTRARIAAGIEKYARPIHLEAAGNTYDAATRGGRYWRAWPMDEPLATVHTTASKAVAVPPLLVPVEGRTGKSAAPVDEPMRTQTARNETGVLVPPFLMRHYTPRGRLAQMCTSPVDPAPTLTGSTTPALVTPPLLVPAGGTWNDEATSLEEPMRTRTTRDTEALVLPPFIAELRGGGSETRPVEDPLATVTASGNHHGLVTAPGDLTAAWAALYGYDTGQLRSLADVLATQTTITGDALLTGDLPDVDECLFRMLEPGEIQLGMAFPRAYRVLGNKRERVRQLGNAVTPPAARDLIACVTEWLTGQPVTPAGQAGEVA